MAVPIRSICSAYRYPLGVFADGVVSRRVANLTIGPEQARQAVSTPSGS